MNEINNWTCSKPRARLVYITDEHPNKITSDTDWVPPATVLYRCEQQAGWYSIRFCSILIVTVD